MDDSNKQRLIGFLLVGAVGLFLFGGFLMFVGFVLGSALLATLGPVLVFFGLVAAGTGLAIGFIHNRDRAHGAPRPQEEGRIMARFAINQLGEMIFDNIDEQAERARYYVRILFLDGRREELECGRPVFDQCGEGMRGLLTMQGGWLTGFQALVDTDETRAAYRGL